MKTPTHLVSHTQCVRSKKKKKNCNSLSEVDALLHMVAGLRRLVRVDVDQVDLDKIGIVDLVSLFIIGFLCLCGCGWGRSGWDWDCAFGKSVYDWVSLSLWMWIRSICMKLVDVLLSLWIMIICLWIRPELWLWTMLIWLWHWLYEFESGGFSLEKSFEYGMDCMNVNILVWLPWSRPLVKSSYYKICFSSSYFTGCLSTVHHCRRSNSNQHQRCKSRFSLQIPKLLLPLVAIWQNGHFRRKIRSVVQ